jgi:hypothetical protein
MRDLMKQAWTLVKVYGFSIAEAMKQAWLLLKLKKALNEGIVKFFYQKLNGEVRTAWGTLKEGLIPETAGNDNRKKNDSVMTYFDQEAGEWRCFKKANLLSIA